MSDIILAASMRANLLSLQNIQMLQSRTSNRLATGLRVGSAIDDAAAYFAAQNERGRANDLDALKQAMGEAIQTVQAANNGVDGITALIQQAKGLIASARAGDTTQRAALATQYTALMTQIDQLAGDSGYKGTNLLAAGSTLTVTMNENGTASVTITGFDASSTGLGLAAAANNWAADADINAAATALDTALNTLRNNASTLSSNNSVITTRQQFTSQMIATLNQGADNLTLADTNEEGANMLALQTRQQLGIQALSLSSQGQQSVLRLFQ